MRKNIILILLIFCQFSVFAQGSNSQADDGDKTVTLTQIGEGRTKEIAKNNALRNAIESAFGTFISSNTTILNDNLIKDEVVSVSSGNIQNFEILSETQMPNGSFSSVVKATVSIGKLTTFFENKGVSVEFKGGLFAANIKLQEVNEKNEKEVMKNLFIILNKIVANGFDYSIDFSEPQKAEYPYKDWIVNFSITALGNNNLKNIQEITMSTINNICLSPEEVTSYKTQNIRIHYTKINGRDYYFRSSAAVIYLRTIFERRIPLASLNFSVSDGINTFNSLSMVTNRKENANENIPYITRCNPRRNAIEVNYNVLYSSDFNGKSEVMNNDVSDFLLDVNTSNFKRIDEEFSDYGTWTTIPELNLNRFTSSRIEIRYCFNKIYTLEQLSKVTGYKVQPIIIQNNTSQVNNLIEKATSILSLEAGIIQEMNGLGSTAADDKRYEELNEKRRNYYKEAIPYLTKALEIDSNNINVATTLMNLYSSLNDNDNYILMKNKVQKINNN